jgi:hypothetical protein
MEDAQGWWESRRVPGGGPGGSFGDGGPKINELAGEEQEQESPDKGPNHTFKSWVWGAIPRPKLRVYATARHQG